MRLHSRQVSAQGVAHQISHLQEALQSTVMCVHMHMTLIEEYGYSNHP